MAEVPSWRIWWGHYAFHLQVSYAQRNFINALSEKNVGAHLRVCAEELLLCTTLQPALGFKTGHYRSHQTELMHAEEFYKALWHFLLIIVAAVFLSTLKPFVGACCSNHPLHCVTPRLRALTWARREALGCAELRRAAARCTISRGMCRITACASLASIPHQPPLQGLLPRAYVLPGSAHRGH